MRNLWTTACSLVGTAVRGGLGEIRTVESADGDVKGLYGCTKQEAIALRMKSMRDYTLVLDRDDVITAHLHVCPDVKTARSKGRPMLSMFACEKPLGDAYRKHNCIKDEPKQEQD